MFAQRFAAFYPENADENEKYIDIFLKVIKENEGSCDEVWFTSAYGYPSLSRHKEIAEHTKTIADRLKKEGIRVSMQIGNTIGHGDFIIKYDCSGIATDLAEAQVLVGPNGELCPLCFCWNDEKFISYIKEKMKYYSVLNPECVWVDDDLRARNHHPVEKACFCDNCISNFNKKYNHSFSREELVKTINRTDKNVRKEWTEFVRAGLYNFTYIMTSEFVKYSPDTKFALQNGANGNYAGYGYDFLLDAMRDATNKKVGYRAGGGCYNDHYIADFLKKARRIDYQHSLLPNYVDELCPEIECLPDVAYGKSVNGLLFETDLYFAYGATSMSYAMIKRPYESMLTYHIKEFSGFARHKNYLSKLSTYNLRTKASGVEFLISKNGYLRDIADSEPDFAYEDRFLFEGGIPSILGMPVCYSSGDKQKVYQLTPEVIKTLPKEEIEFLLTQPVITSGGAITVLLSRGYDVFGISVHRVPTVAMKEVFLDCEINKKLFGTEWDQAYFDKSGYAFLPTGINIIPINKFSAQNLSVNPFFPDNKYPYGISAVISITNSGGKWAIFGNNPWSSIVSHDRRNQIISAIDYISKNATIKAYLSDPLQAIVRPRVTADGKLACVSLVTAVTGKSEELTLVVRNPESECFKLVWGDGEISNLSYEKKNGEYLIKIPSIDGWSVATVFCE